MEMFAVLNKEKPEVQLENCDKGHWINYSTKHKTKSLNKKSKLINNLKIKQQKEYFCGLYNKGKVNWVTVYK